MSNKKRRRQGNGADSAESGGGPDVPAVRYRQSKDRCDCDSYERLIQELETRVPEAADFDRLAAHEAACPTGSHSEAGVEKALGLPCGAIRHGSAEHGLPSPRQLVRSLIERHLRTKHRSR